jgi:hypothetical protein
VTSPFMAAAWVETVMRAELCNWTKAADSRQRFELTAVRSLGTLLSPSVGPRTVFNGKTAKPGAARSSDTDNTQIAAD